MHATTVELRGLTKRFGPTLALSDVSLAAAPGTVHAITGENGAGKSTLMKILAGVYRPDAGEILFGGQAMRLAHPGAARRAGVATVFQELTVIGHLSVAENIHLGNEPRRMGLLDGRRMQRQARQVLALLGLDVDPHSPCSALTLGERQMVEVAKGMVSDARIFIFDEPTAALNKAEVDQLARLIARLQREGKVIFYISHRLEEIFRLCQQVTVLKDGHHAATEPTAGLTHDRLVALMVGRPLASLYPPRTDAAPEVALDVRRLVLHDGGPPITFALRRGEILGIAGLEGQGQPELMRALAGARPAPQAQVLHHCPGHGAQPVPLHRGVAAVVAQGIALVPEERKSEGLYLDLTARQNIGLGLHRARALWQRAKDDPARVEAVAERLRLQAGNIGVRAASLSGGNQQKVMLARWLVSGVDVLLIEQPTRGVDIGAKAEIYQVLRDFCTRGGAVLVVSSDLPELLGLCNRLLVMHAAAMMAEFDAQDASEQAVLDKALGTPERSGAP